MRILMLGNSFIFVNDLPSLIHDLTGWEVVQHTRGGAHLAEQLNPNTRMGALTQKSFAEEKWDYVVLQEMSNGPVKTKKKFLQNAKLLCDQIRAIGAKPVFYATWAYYPDSVPMENMGMSYDEMYEQMYASYHEAAEENDALIADVGKAFYELGGTRDLYMDDGLHPSMKGSQIAAQIIAQTIQEDLK